MDNPTKGPASPDASVVKYEGPRKGRVAEFDAAHVEAISEAVYRSRLCDESGDGADERMIEKDGDGGAKLRGRARAYDALTRAYLRVIKASAP